MASHSSTPLCAVFVCKKVQNFGAPMPSLHFTELAIQRLKTTGEFFDTTTPAFGVRVGKHRKTWFVIRGKADNRMRTTIGRAGPDGLSLAVARKAAKDLLNTAPSETSRMKFSEAYDLFKLAIETKRPTTQKAYRRLIEKRLLPSF